jgi:hypothetical protein
MNKTHVYLLVEALNNPTAQVFEYSITSPGNPMDISQLEVIDEAVKKYCKETRSSYYLSASMNRAFKDKALLDTKYNAAIAMFELTARALSVEMRIQRPNGVEQLDRMLHVYPPEDRMDDNDEDEDEEDEEEDEEAMEGEAELL